MGTAVPGSELERHRDREGRPYIDPHRTIRPGASSDLQWSASWTRRHALTIGEWRGVFAVALALFALLWKIRVEEARMLNVFPEYQHYEDETWALIPFIF
jgi:hypothetical protein